MTHASLPTIRYGPVTVNPRKEPSKTLFTGRRSKYEVLSADEEEKRRDRRERNRVAATKCREKRENVLGRLEREFREEMEKHQQLTKLVGDLEQKKLVLESTVADHSTHCVLVNNANPTLDSTSSSMIFGGTDFLSSIIDAPAPPLPVNPPILTYSEEEELSRMFEPNFLLTNSAYANEGARPDFISPQQYSFIMSTASLDRILNNLRSPTISMESANNSSSLFNSAPGVSCAKQYSGPGEDEALADAFLVKDYIFWNSLILYRW